MITRALLSWWAGMTEWMAGLLPMVPENVFSFLGQTATAFNLIASKVVLLDPVIPFEVLELCFVGMMYAMGIALTIEIGRIILSYLTLGGGAT